MDRPRLTALLILFLSAGGRAAPPPIEPPDHRTLQGPVSTPADLALQDVLQAINDPDGPATERILADAGRPGTDRDRTRQALRERMRNITRRTGGLDFLRPAFHRRRTPLQTTAVVRFRNNPDAWNELTVRVSEEPPQGLLDITLEPTRIGTPAPDWTLTTPNGETIRLRQLRGQVVVLEFWATWCAPCVAMLPALQRIHEAFRGKRVRVVGVNIWEHFGGQREGLAGFLKAHSVSYPTVIGNDDVVKAFQIRSIPALFVIDPAGRIAYVSYGMHSDRDYESDLRSLIRILLEGMSR